MEPFQSIRTSPRSQTGIDHRSRHDQSWDRLTSTAPMRRPPAPV